MSGELNFKNLDLENSPEPSVVKAVVEEVKKALDKIEKSEFESQQIADFESQYQWFLGLALLLLLADIFLLEKKTNWVQKLNLFNEKKHE
jgi:Ca-activated chloride channel family protein